MKVIKTLLIAAVVTSTTVHVNANPLGLLMYGAQALSGKATRDAKAAEQEVRKNEKEIEAARYAPKITLPNAMEIKPGFSREQIQGVLGEPAFTEYDRERKVVKDLYLVPTEFNAPMRGKVVEGGRWQDLKMEEGMRQEVVITYGASGRIMNMKQLNVVPNAQSPFTPYSQKTVGGLAFNYHPFLKTLWGVLAAKASPAHSIPRSEVIQILGEPTSSLDAGEYVKDSYEIDSATEIVLAFKKSDFMKFYTVHLVDKATGKSDRLSYSAKNGQVSEY